MARPLGSASTAKLEFFSKFDQLCKVHIDPLELMFRIAKNDKTLKSGKITISDRAMAARELLSYRYPKLKAIEQKLDTGDGIIQISWLDDLEDSDGRSGQNQLPTPCISIKNPPGPSEVQGNLLSQTVGENSLCGEPVDPESFNLSSP